MRKAIALTLLAFGTASVCQAQETKPPCALGYCMGQPVMEVSTKEDGIHLYVTESDYFTYLVVGNTPKAGVCKVAGLQNVPNPDKYGVEHRMAFDNIADKIVAKYGEPESKVDRLLPGSIWDEPQDWLMGLWKKERYLFWDWNLPQLNIRLYADPEHIELSYQFSNFDACKSEAEESILPEF